MAYSVRKMQPDDVEVVVRLIREFAAFENLSDHCAIDQERLGAAVFGPGKTAEGIVASDDGSGELAGYMLFFPNFSSFRGHQGFYLDDIYVTEQHRGKGVGEMMLRELAKLGLERGYERIDFLVLEWNAPAVEFYKKLGAVIDDAERHFKFTDAAFRRLAE